MSSRHRRRRTPSPDCQGQDSLACRHLKLWGCCTDILYKTSNFPPRNVIVADIHSSVLQAQSKQIAHEGLQKDRPRAVEVKMIAGNHSNLTGSHSHFAPSRQPPRFDSMILQPTVDCHRAFQRGFRMILVSLADFEIRADRRQQQIQQFVVLQHFHRSAIELTKLFDQLAFRQAGERFFPHSAMRSLSRRDEQMGRLTPVLSAQAARRFKAQQRSQAVAEENKGLVQVRRQLLRHDAAERYQSSDMRFPESVTATWQLNRSHLHARWQMPGPIMKDLCAPARIMKAEQPQRSRRIRPWEKKPFI